MQDVRGMYLQPGMYIVYAVEYNDSLEIRIGRIIEVKQDTKHSLLRIKSARKDYTGKWVNVRSSGLTNRSGIFAVSNTHIPDEVRTILERD